MKPKNIHTHIDVASSRKKMNWVDNMSRLSVINCQKPLWIALSMAVFSYCGDNRKLSFLLGITFFLLLLRKKSQWWPLSKSFPLWFCYFVFVSDMLQFWVTYLERSSAPAWKTTHFTRQACIWTTAISHCNVILTSFSGMWK